MPSSAPSTAPQALPERWRSGVEGAAHYPQLVQRIVDADLAAGADDDRGAADIWFLLDRSGSMQSIARDVVAGFERFFAAQRELAGDATVTIVQFDGDDPHEVLVDAAPLSAVGPVRFEPRGMTPLYDAVGLLLDRAERRGGDDADQLVVILTDGDGERQPDLGPAAAVRTRSVRCGRGDGRSSSSAPTRTATPPATRSGSGPATSATSDPTRPGSTAAYDGLSRTVGEWRGKSRLARRRDRDDFWGGRKEAEER